MCNSNHAGMALKGLFAAVLLAIAGAATAATVIRDPSDATKAIGIENLDISGVLLNVEFTDLQPAAATYGEFPGDFAIFDLEDEAALAMDAVDDALSAAIIGVLSVGAETLDEGEPIYSIGFGSEVEVPLPPVVVAWASAHEGSGDWGRNPSAFTFPYDDVNRVWATFTVVPVPAAVWLFGSALGMLGWYRRRTA